MIYLKLSLALTILLFTIQVNTLLLKQAINKNSTITVLGEAEETVESTSFAVSFTLSSESPTKEEAEKLNSERVNKIAKDLLNAGIDFKKLAIDNVDSSTECDGNQPQDAAVKVILQTKLSLNDLTDFSLIDKIKSILNVDFAKDKFIKYHSNGVTVEEIYDQLLQKARDNGRSKALRKLKGTKLKLGEALESEAEVKIENGDKNNGEISNGNNANINGTEGNQGENSNGKYKVKVKITVKLTYCLV